MKETGVFPGLLMLAGVLAALLAAGGCAEKITGSNRPVAVAVRIDAKPLAPGATSAIDSYRLTVEGKGFSPIVTPLQLQDGYLIGKVSVPAGPHRHFIVEALEKGVVLYRGDTYADVLLLGATELAINLFPAVPMVYMTPHMQANIMGDSFYIDISVHGVPNLQQINLVLSHNNAPFYIDPYTAASIVKGDDLDSNSSLSWFSQPNVANTYTIQLYRRPQTGSLTDATGYVRLARLQLQSYYDWLDTATVNFNIEVNYLLGTNGDTISTAGVRTDQAIVNMSAPIVSISTFGGPGNETGYAVTRATDGGYLFAGVTDSYGDGGGEVYLVKTDSRGAFVWQKTFGGVLLDGARGIAPTGDGGGIICGYTRSFGAGSDDVYLVKAAADGVGQWPQVYGGPLRDGGHAVITTPDGGYAIAGYTASSGAGGNDMYLVKTDGSGNMQWSKTYGGSAGDEAHAVVLAGDGGYVIIGDTYSFGAGEVDVYMVKADSLGNKVWQKTFGGAQDERGNAVARTRDGGYIIAGRTSSLGAGLFDVYIVKTDAEGNMTWQSTLGGTSADEGSAIVQTDDGGYVVTGYTNSSGAGGFDVCLAKVDGGGQKVWERTFGGAGDEAGNALAMTDNGGYVIAGWTNSSGAGGDDLYVIRTDADGNIVTR